MSTDVSPITQEERAALFDCYENDRKPIRYFDEHSHGHPRWSMVAEDLNAALSIVEVRIAKLEEELAGFRKLYGAPTVPCISQKERAALRQMKIPTRFLHSRSEIHSPAYSDELRQAYETALVASEEREAMLVASLEDITKHTTNCTVLKIACSVIEVYRKLERKERSSSGLNV